MNRKSSTVSLIKYCVVFVFRFVFISYSHLHTHKKMKHWHHYTCCFDFVYKPLMWQFSRIHIRTRAATNTHQFDRKGCPFPSNCCIQYASQLSTSARPLNGESCETVWCSALSGIHASCSCRGAVGCVIAYCYLHLSGMAALQRTARCSLYQRFSTTRLSISNK